MNKFTTKKFYYECDNDIPHPKGGISILDHYVDFPSINFPSSIENEENLDDKVSIDGKWDDNDNVSKEEKLDDNNVSIESKTPLEEPIIKNEQPP